MLWYSLEAPHGSASNEYPKHMFLWRLWNKKKVYLITSLIESYDKVHFLALQLLHLFTYSFDFFVLFCFYILTQCCIMKLLSRLEMLGRF